MAVEYMPGVMIDAHLAIDRETIVASKLVYYHERERWASQCIELDVNEVEMLIEELQSAVEAYERSEARKKPEK